MANQNSSESNGPLGGRCCKVAVIGAGAAGLIAARELREEGHGVVVLERIGEVGGLWVYDPRVESDPLGLDAGRTVVGSSMYASQRTNVPREIMGFSDYPFVVVEGEGRDSRRFPGHREVVRYLRDFAAHFDLFGLIRFRTEVVHVGMSSNNRWIVRSRPVNAEGEAVGDEPDDVLEEIYDAVVVCNGHYTQPRIAEFPGIDKWPGKQLHSHNYRVPDPFRDQVVVVIGNSSSGEDVSRELASVAKEVHIAAKSIPTDANMSKPLFGNNNIWLHPVIESAREDGTVTFKDGASIFADTIIHCTGYSYRFPFLDTKGIVKIDDNVVGPLYEHVFPPLLAPSLSFVGLPWKIVPFPLYELQSKWIARVLSGKVILPSEKDMMKAVTDFYARVEAAGLPKRYTHNINRYQFEYDDWLADQCGCDHVEVWRKEIYAATANNRRLHPDTYRDEWEDHHWHEIALLSQTNIATQANGDLNYSKDQKGGGPGSTGTAV